MSALSIEELFGAPARMSATISPDGTRIAYLAAWRESRGQWLLERELYVTLRG